MEAELSCHSFLLTLTWSVITPVLPKFARIHSKTKSSFLICITLWLPTAYSLQRVTFKALPRWAQLFYQAWLLLFLTLSSSHMGCFAIWRTHHVLYSVHVIVHTSLTVGCFLPNTSLSTLEISVNSHGPDIFSCLNLRQKQELISGYSYIPFPTIDSISTL